MKTITNKNVRETITRHRKRKNISNTFKGTIFEEIFFTKVIDGLKKFLEPPTWV